MIIKLPFSTEQYCSGSFGAVREQLRTVLEQYQCISDIEDLDLVLDISERDTDFDEVAASIIARAINDMFNVSLKFESVYAIPQKGVYADGDASQIDALKCSLEKCGHLGEKYLSAEKWRLDNAYSAPEGAEINAAPVAAAWNYIQELLPGFYSATLEEWDDELNSSLHRAIREYREIA